MSKESIVRESVALNLKSLDPSLRLVAQEHYISMPDGSKAFIDILAKDDYGCFTVIEIKKSNQTARSATQQLYKYASFLKKKNRLEESQIRCFILSTTWEELYAPFSEFEKFSTYESKGYKITYQSDGAPIFTEVDPIYETGNIHPLDNFIFFEFNTPSERDNTLANFEGILNSLPSVNSVLIKVDHDGIDQAIIHPSGFAWVMFTGDAKNIEGDLSKIEPAPASPEDFSPGFLVQMWELESTEYTFRTKILTNHVRIKNGEGQYTGLALHSLNNTLATWKYQLPICFGPMFEDSLFDPDDILSMSLGHVGQHPYNFVIKTTPKRPKQFLMVRENLNGFLSTNSRWRRLVKSILDSMDGDDIANIWIYNPLNFFGMINDVYETGGSQRIPRLHIDIMKNDGSEVRFYGALFWRNKVVPEPPELAIQSSYPNVEYFKIRSVIHTMTEYDESLSNRYGLSYEIVSSQNAQRFLSFDGNEDFQHEPEALENLRDFLNSNDALIDEVGRFFKQL